MVQRCRVEELELEVSGGRGRASEGDRWWCGSLGTELVKTYREQQSSDELSNKIGLWVYIHSI